jgi:hypothetical protein
MARLLAEGGGLMTVHDDLAEVLQQLEAMDAGIVRFSVWDLSEFEATRWLHSERKRLLRLNRAVSDTLIPTPPVSNARSESTGNPQVVEGSPLPSHRRRGARSR